MRLLNWSYRKGNRTLNAKTRIASLVAICILLAGCREVGQPQSEIEEERLVNVIKDLLIVQHGVNSMNLPPMERDSLHFVLRKRVFDKYGTDSAAVVNSIKGWESHPNHMDTLYANVLKSLNIESATLEMSQNLDKNKP